MSNGAVMDVFFSEKIKIFDHSVTRRGNGLVWNELICDIVPGEVTVGNITFPNDIAATNDLILSLIDTLGYKPVTHLVQTPINIKATTKLMENMKAIAKIYYERLLSDDVLVFSSVNHDGYMLSIQLEILYTDNTPIYLPKNQMMDMDDFIVAKFLSLDDTIMHVWKEHHNPMYRLVKFGGFYVFKPTFDYIKERMDIPINSKIEANLAVLLRDFQYEHFFGTLMEEMDEIYSTITNKLMDYRKKGYFYLAMDMCYPEDDTRIFYLRDFLSLWGCDLIDTCMDETRDSRVIYGAICKSNSDIITAAIVKEAMEGWREDEIPTITVAIPEIISIPDSYYARESNEEYIRITMKYLSHLAYAKLCKKYPELWVVSNRVDVTFNILGKIPLSTAASLEDFIFFLKGEYNTLFIHLSVVPIDSLVEGYLCRWYLLHGSDELDRLILSHENFHINDYHENLMNELKIPDVKGWELSSAIIDSMVVFKNYLTTDLQKLRNLANSTVARILTKESILQNLQDCHDNIDVTTMEKFSDMELEDLIGTLKVINGTTYCFSIGAVSKMEAHPITRANIPYNIKVKSKFRYGAIEGLYDSIIMGGIYDFFPTYEACKLEVPSAIEDEESWAMRKVTSVHFYLVSRYLDIEPYIEDTTGEKYFGVYPKWGLFWLNLGDNDRSKYLKI